MRATKKPDPHKAIVAKFPLALVKKLDAAAKSSDRSRSAELRVRLEASLAQDFPPALVSGRGAR
ncbi:TraY domain-containing protein [Paucibacter sp. Y2R2-4]|uniref:TraY domain-containing protein n=1 Tax=Paucibacter sp. Y2R2-4 TaxID=2893553 RepID=UPI0021E3857C|nr:TraY domain-containing protein [Paucibacter sp. Y2R2-4]MCV2349324.1 TraY domain-containing protein [Paucibacter sp. Y2R2-4]